MMAHPCGTLYRYTKQQNPAHPQRHRQHARGSQARQSTAADNDNQTELERHVGKIGDRDRHHRLMRRQFIEFKQAQAG